MCDTNRFKVRASKRKSVRQLDPIEEKIDEVYHVT